MILRRFSLKNNLIRLSLLVSLFTLLLCAVTIFFLREGINDEVREHNDTVIALMKTQIQESVVLPVNMLDKTGELVKKGYTIDGQFITDYFETILLAHDYFTDIHIINNDGIIVNSAPVENNGTIGTSAVYEPFFVVAQDERIVFTKVYISSHTGEPTISVSIDKHDFVIVADIDLNSLPISLKSVTEIDELMNLAILDQWGTYIVSDDHTNLNQRRQYPEFREILAADASNITLENISYEHMDSLGWYIVYELNTDVLYGDINRISIILLTSWFLLTALLLAVVYYNTQRANVEISMLQERTKNIIDGDYREGDKSYRFVEFDALAKDFQVMSHEIERREKEIEEINDTLQRNIAIAEEASKAKSNFLAVMSHEMRTPLNGILGFLQMLKLSELRKEDRELVNIISNSTQVLKTLINDILDVSKYEMGTTQFDSVSFDITKLIITSVKPYRTIAEDNNLKFELNLGYEKSCWVNGDPIKLTQVLNNLLDNAIKFTKEGMIRVSSSIEVVEDSIMLKMSVSDSGIGIKKEVIPLLCKPFEQGDESIQRRFGGTGLGLAICKEIVQRMNGDIQVESVYGIGSTISFTVMLSMGGPDDASSIQNQTIEKKAFEQTRVLVVEDNKVNQMLIHRFLNKYGIDSDIAVNGQEAVNLFDYGRYHMIFMDCQMPVMDGFEATRMIRKIDEDINIIAMTAYATKEDRERCFQAGMSDFLTKPLDLRKVSKMLGVEALYMADLSGEQAEASPQLNEIEKQAKYLVDKIGFDYETCMELVTTYVGQAREIFDVMMQYDAHNEREEVLKKVHQIKGATGAVRLTDIYQMIVDSENKMKNDDYASGMIIIREVMRMPIYDIE